MYFISSIAFVLKNMSNYEHSHRELDLIPFNNQLELIDRLASNNSRIITSNNNYKSSQNHSNKYALAAIAATAAVQQQHNQRLQGQGQGQGQSQREGQSQPHTHTQPQTQPHTHTQQQQQSQSQSQSHLNPYTMNKFNPSYQQAVQQITNPIQLSAIHSNQPQLNPASLQPQQEDYLLTSTSSLPSGSTSLQNVTGPPGPNPLYQPNAQSPSGIHFPTSQPQISPSSSLVSENQSTDYKVGSSHSLLSPGTFKYPIDLNYSNPQLNDLSSLNAFNETWDKNSIWNKGSDKNIW